MTVGLAAICLAFAMAGARGFVPRGTYLASVDKG